MTKVKKQYPKRYKSKQYVWLHGCTISCVPENTFNDKFYDFHPEWSNLSEFTSNHNTLRQSLNEFELQPVAVL